MDVKATRSGSGIVGEERGDTAEHTSRRGAESTALAANEIWHLLGFLQDSEGLTDFAERLSLKLAFYVRHDGLRYRDRERGVDALAGRTARHRCALRVSANGADLGEILVYRSKRFDSPEIDGLEALVGLLHDPLRRAIEFHDGGLVASSDPPSSLREEETVADLIRHEMAVAASRDNCAALVLVSIDEYALLKRQFGRKAGDELLRRVADLLSLSLDAAHPLFPYRSDSFVAILGSANTSGIIRGVRHLLNSMRTCSIGYDGGSVDVTVSAGVAVATGRWSASVLLDGATDALDKAQKAGGNRLKFARPVVVDGGDDSESATRLMPG